MARVSQNKQPAENARNTPPKPGLFARAKTRLSDYMAQRPHRSFRISKKTRQEFGGKKLPTTWMQLRQTLALIRQEKKLLLGATTLYAIIGYVFIGGVQQLDFLALKDATLDVFGGQIGTFGKAITLYTTAMGGALSPQFTELQQFLAFLLGLLFWLAIVWLLRMRLAGHTVNIRDAVYNSAAPIISTLIVMLVLCVQLVPTAIGMAVFVIAQSGGFLQGGIEVMSFAIAAFLLCVLSLYWLTGTLLALVVVTIPQTYPWRALSLASKLVIGQRWKLLWRLVVFAIVVMVLWAVVLLPMLLVDGWLRFEWLPIVPFAIQALSAFSLLLFSVYVYKIYRNLL